MLWRDAVSFKQKERESRIAALSEYCMPILDAELKIINTPCAITSGLIRRGELSPRQVLKAYAKKALSVHERTNCLTEIAIDCAEDWADAANLEGPLAGIPVSLKDVIHLGGYDHTTGFTSRVGHPSPSDSPLVRLLRDAGAVPYVKTNVPLTMMSIQSYNDLWGLTKNHFNPKYSPGGSSSGEGALIGGGGSRIGIGTDVGGSVRVPAAFSGIYSLRPTSNRFPFTDEMCVSNGFEGIPSVAGPMARSLDDLRWFTNGVMAMEPWKYDYKAMPLPWRTRVDLGDKPKVGVQRSNDVLNLTPAVSRALDLVVHALEEKGCEVTEFTPLGCNGRSILNTSLRLFLGDGYESLGRELQPGETNDPKVGFWQFWSRLPGWIRHIWKFIQKVVLKNTEWAGMLDLGGRRSVAEYYDDVAERERLRENYWKAWNESGIKFLITPVHPAPALPAVYPASSLTWLLTTQFNLLDMPAGVLPVTRVDKHLDQVDVNLGSLNLESRAVFDVYDPEEMNGLPVAVQIVAKRYDDEVVLEAMQFVESALKEQGNIFEALIEPH